MFGNHFDALSVKADYEQKKATILLGIIQSLKTLKHLDFAGDEQARKCVKGFLKKKILSDLNIFVRLKNLILLRERDRSSRVNSIRVLKKLIKFSKKSTQILLEQKFDILVCFILEREYKHPQVVQERLQSFKFIITWLNRSPHNFPFLFG